MTEADMDVCTVDILGLGNPLLDISAEVDQAFLDKYKIKMDNAILAQKEHMPMYEELASDPNVIYIAGGATLNTVRMAQWASAGRPGTTGYIGCIGKDKFGDQLQAAVKKDGVSPAFMISDKVATGTCAIAIKDKERTMVANLAAANEYKDTHFDEHGERMAYRAKVIYSCGFFLTVSPATMLKCAKITCKTGAIYSIGLAAPFVLEFFAKPFHEVMAYTDLVFGSIEEAGHYAKINKLEDQTCPGIAKHFANLPFKKKGRHRVCVLTQCSQRTCLARSDGLYMEVPVEKLNKEHIVDLNAAGDSFVGGFLAALVDGKSYQQCIEMGHRCSRWIIQQSGCAINGKSSSKLWDN